MTAAQVKEALISALKAYILSRKLDGRKFTGFPWPSYSLDNKTSAAGKVIQRLSGEEGEALSKLDAAMLTQSKLEACFFPHIAYWGFEDVAQFLEHLFSSLGLLTYSHDHFQEELAAGSFAVIYKGPDQKMVLKRPVDPDDIDFQHELLALNALARNRHPQITEFVGVHHTQFGYGFLFYAFP